jgi:hypothetical protein
LPSLTLLTLLALGSLTKLRAAMIAGLVSATLLALLALLTMLTMLTLFALLAATMAAAVSTLMRHYSILSAAEPPSRTLSETRLGREGSCKLTCWATSSANFTRARAKRERTVPMGMCNISATVL